LSIGGPVRCNRAYYLCRSCGHGSCPFDQAVGLPETNVTPAVERLTALAGAVSDSFEKGAELLAEMAGVRLCESSVQRTTEAVGQRIADALVTGRRFGPDHPWKFYHDALGRSIAYIEVDATGVRQQGSHGEQVAGRMAYVGMICNPLPDPERCFCDRRRPGERMAARYVSGLYPLADMGPLLRQQGAQVGLDEAEIWVAISDGGAGLEDFIESNFPRVEVVILDYWHVVERLAGLAAVLYAFDEEQARSQGKEWSRILKEEGGTTLIAVLEAWPWPERVAGLKAARAELLIYLKNHVHRMDYPAYEANGWYIGSGAIESACKTVVGQRLKGAGMRWSERGAHEVCHVRALYRSEPSQWSAFWQRDIRS
jgi:hypothetical protein